MVKCNEDDCNKRAIYGYEFRIPLKCPEHRIMPGMKNILDIMCSECDKVRPTFGLEKGKATHCDKCKTPEMFNVKDKLCIKCDKVKPCFGLIKGKATHCDSCKTPEMFNVKDKLCIKCDLSRPSFGIEKGKPTHCTKCKEPHMFDVTNKLCIVCNIKHPTYGLEKGQITHCLDCKTDNMFDTSHLQCKVCNNTRANPVYKGHCARCYGNLFPDSPLIRNFKTKERNVVDFIREQYPDLTWKFDKIIEDACSKRRPDIYLDLGYQVIIIEVDENQHKFYENICENKRIMEISQDVGHRPIVFIRFNPDKYLDKNNKNIPSCFSISKETGLVKINIKKNWNERLNSLKESVDYWLENETEKTIEIIQLYYDGF
jgi:hypothetical protein